MRSSLFVLPVLLVLGAVASVAVGQSPPSLQPEKVIGRYEATRFTLVQGSAETDLLCAGAALNIDVTADFVAGGALVLPDTLGLPPSRPSLFGPYQLGPGTVRFEPAAGTFFSGAEWTWHAGGVLTTEVSSDGRTYQVELQRQ